MKQKNGFTLVELLAVVGVLAILTLISIPTIDSLIKRNREKVYKMQIQTIKDGLKSWSDGNTEYLPINASETLTIDLGFLKAAGFVEPDITNPINNKCFPNDMALIIKKIANNYEYIVDEDSGTETNSDCKIVIPEGSDVFVFFMGSQDITIYTGDSFIDSGIRIIDRTGAKITTEITTTIKDVNGNIVNSIKTDKEGYYTITYTYKAFRNNTIVKSGALVRTVVVDIKENEFLYKDSVLKGANPVLNDNMIPVVISNDGTVKKADVTKEWFSYQNANWANAVVVTPETRVKYLDIKPGNIINQEDINGYFVWIPRFKYGINSASKTINIDFESKVFTKSMGDAKGLNYRTHPAFTFDGRELNGFWVGKFETSNTAENPRILPNKPSLRNLNVNQQLNSSFKFQTVDYANTPSKVIKNTEWGAVAYLSHSIYGINKEIRLNNNSNFITGCGASTHNANGNSACQIEYGKATEYPQSTTGNITGIFDMSGGSWEIAMSYNTLSANISIDPKYYNITEGQNLSISCGGSICYGEAFDETTGWYNDYAYPNDSSNSWLYRGGGNSNNERAGIFSFGILGSQNNGPTLNTFRITLNN